ncbi:MAG: HlyD family efflux transporter periplasmic adaptor subunit [Cyclobacteriaceae bacterium]
MKWPLFPEAFISSSLEHYTFRINKSTSSIYVVVISTIASALVATPFIFLDLNVNAQGLITTEEERYELYCPVNAVILEDSLIENEKYLKGQVLMTFDDSAIEKELTQLKFRLAQFNGFKHDLLLLLNANISNTEMLNTQLYQLEFSKYTSLVNKLELEKETLRKVFNRQQILHTQNVISDADFESDKSKYDLALAEIDHFKKRTTSSWKEKLISYEESIETLTLKIKSLLDEQTKYQLHAPVSGEAQNIKSLVSGQFLSLGSKLGDISPDAALIAVCWIKPHDIGLIQKGMALSLNVTAFNSSDWGFLRGKVSHISSDVYMLDNQPYFKVKCDLNSDHLALKNGFEGKLKKGMTLQAHFQVTSRSVFQLLNDKLDNWLNPQTLSEHG